MTHSTISLMRDLALSVMLNNWRKRAVANNDVEVINGR